MLDLERDEKILAVLQEKTACTVYELSQVLYVSESTVRRDLSRMEQKGLITRTFGGAIIKSNPVFEDTSFFLREKENLQEKRALCRQAVSYIQSNTSLFIDSSTTCLQIASMLNDVKNLLIVTNGLMIANELVTRTKHRVTVLGGDIQPSTNSVLGSNAEKMLSGLHAALSILSSSAVDLHFGFSEQAEGQASLKKIMLANSDRSIFLIHDSKINKKSLAQTCAVKDASIIISTAAFPDEYLKAAPLTQFVVAKQ
jgi:DeoR/GlpR family transcriptional regulator of sugar metabolism